MHERLNKLLGRYFEGESSLEEEKEIRDLLQNTDGYETEKEFFLGLKMISKMDAKKEIHLKPRQSFFSNWSKVAAALLVFLVAGTALLRYQERQKEQEAYEQVMQAFALIQSNMLKGLNSMEAMEDFRHLNTTDEIFDLNQKKQTE